MDAKRPRTLGRGEARGRQAAGFTLLELIVVVAIIGIIATIAVPNMIDRPRRAKEAVLRHNLMAIRDALDQHYGDKGHYPESLEALVEAGYFRVIPMDPITGSNLSWEPKYEEEDPDAPPAETDKPEGGGPGIVDVHSGSEEVALDGTPYRDW
jgi:type II secretion system protein G